MQSGVLRAVMLATDPATDPATPAPLDWTLARTLYVEQGLSCSEIATRLSCNPTTVREHCAKDKWVMQRAMLEQDQGESWRFLAAERYRQAVTLLKSFEATTIEDLDKLESACKKHIDAGMKLFGFDKPEGATGPSAMVQVNVSTGHATDAGQVLRANAAKHAKQARPGPHTQDSTAVPPASDPSKA
jgi:hypothetical protein